MARDAGAQEAWTDTTVEETPKGLRIVPGEKRAIDALVAELAGAVNRRGIVN